MEIFRLFFSASWNEISNKSNLWERVCVPDLQIESWRDLWDGLVPGEHTLLPGDHDLLLGRQVLEGEDKPPVEVSLPSQRPVVDVCGLYIIRALQPPGTNFIFLSYCTLYYVLYFQDLNAPIVMWTMSILSPYKQIAFPGRYILCYHHILLRTSNEYFKGSRYIFFWSSNVLEAKLFIKNNISKTCNSVPCQLH